MFKYLCVLLCGVAFLPVIEGQPKMLEASIEDLNEWLNAGQLSSVELVQFYLDRIEAYDQAGPSLNTIQHMNAQAYEQARALEKEREEKGGRSLLHGIPLLVKDNYETIDAPTTAGSAIIADHWPKQDATQVARLREAGAIILAKTTMHEFAYGWTTRGSAFGVTRNPYDPRRHPGGSSGGTGAAVAANFAAAGMGSDTCGSIRVPAAHNNLFGLRGTQGISSRSGIIPLSSSRDIGGPLARSVRDLAVLLDATVGYDPNDLQTVETLGKIPTSYLENLKQIRLNGLNIGVLTDWFGSEEQHTSVNTQIDQVLEMFRKNGADVTDLGGPELRALWEQIYSPFHYFVDDYDLKKDLTDYLRQYPELPVQSFKELVDDSRLESVVARNWRTLLDDQFESREIYLERHEAGRELRKQLLSLMHDHQRDVLVYPTATEEAVLLNAEQGHQNCKLAAGSGMPAITVPIGFGSSGMPIGLEMLAEPWAEQKLLNYAYTLEQMKPSRRLPSQTP